MILGTADIFLLVFIVAALVLGFFWGSVRSLLLAAAWLIAFLAGAYLMVQFGTYLADQWENFPATFSEMAAFGIVYVGLLIASPVIVFLVSRSYSNLTRYQVADDLLGAALAVFVALLCIAGLEIVLATFYGSGTTVDAGGGPQWTANLWDSLINSTIGGAIWDYLVPVIGWILGPILPADVSAVFG
jgi:uncharacterized membrane protein required for colicin V production